MKRRKFLKYTTAAAATPLMLNGIAVQAIATPLMMSAFNCSDSDDRVMVLVKLNGGNDGLNTVVPLDQLSTYNALRPTIALNESNVINLDANHDVALHPALSPFKDMYDAGKMRLLQGVGYADTNGSHFKSTDLWLTGGDSTPANFNLTSGWVGRYLEYEYPSLIGSPSGQNPDPLAIQLSDKKQSVAFKTTSEYTSAVNLTGINLGDYSNLVQGIGNDPLTNIPSGDYGSEISYIQLIESNTNVYADRVTQVFNSGNNSSVSYPNTGLAGQLKTVARLLAGGCQTKVFLVDVNGFDTHDVQVESGATSTGWHAESLTELAQGIKAFHDDIEALGVADRVLTCTFSEFGRRAIENGNRGTDHGTIAPMFVFGNGVEAGVSGANNDLNSLEYGINLTNQQYDYRQAYSTIMQDWLGSGDGALAATFSTVWAKIPNVINSDFFVDPVCYGQAALPVTLSYFHAKAINNKVVNLDWETALEENHNYFEIERSKNGQDFVSILRVEGEGAGTETATQYREIDNQPFEGDSFYRLKIVALNGEFRYSEVRKVRIELGNLKNLKVYPSPATYDINVVVTSEDIFAANVKIISAAGMIHRTELMNVRQGFNKLNIDVSRLSAGNYFVHFENNKKGILETMPLTIQR